MIQSVTIVDNRCSTYVVIVADLQVVKQTVMTVVYGVTWVGGRQQVEVGGANMHFSLPLDFAGH